MKRKPKKDLWMNLTSMTDMVFLLLTFFIIGTSFGAESKLKLKLPSSKVVKIEERSEPKKITIEVGLNDQIALNGEMVTMEELDMKLAALASEDTDVPVILKGDKGVDYGRIIKVIGFCMSHNLTKFGMAALPEEKS